MPYLESFVELAHEVSANFVVDNTVETTSTVLWWIANIHSRLASLRIVCHTSWSHLCSFELD